jgi:hypothetical protein
VPLSLKRQVFDGHFGGYKGRTRGDSDPVSPPDAQQLLARVATIEEELERARERLIEGEEKLDILEQEKQETLGVLTIARRALTDLEQRLAEQRHALAEAEREEAHRRLEKTISDRDSVALRLAETADRVLSNLDELEAARAAVAAAHRPILDDRGARGPVEVPPEPAELAESWDRLVARLRSEIGRNLEEELLEAAARSPMGFAIKDLPTHLRAAAQERRRELMKAAAHRSTSSNE